MLDDMTNVKASEVLKELKVYIEDLPHYSPDEVAEALEMGIKALEQKSYKSEARRWKRRYLDLKQRIIKLEEQTRWIPVSERLPKDRELVLFSKKTDRVFEGRYFDNDTDHQWYSFRDETFAWNNVVTAWMPLPEPYKAESEDKE